MTKYLRYRNYSATFTPRDDEQFKLKDEVRQFIGRRLLLQCYGPIPRGGGRDRYAGECEFVLHRSVPVEDDMPVWFAEGDLSDIEEAS